MNDCPFLNMASNYFSNSGCSFALVLVLLFICTGIGYWLGNLKNKNKKKTQKKKGFAAFVEKKVKKMGILDIKCSQISALILGILIAKSLPCVLTLRIRWLLLLIILFSLKPFYTVWIKKDN